MCVGGGGECRFLIPLKNIHVINFKKASGRFFFHFLEVFEKCTEYIRIFFIHFREISVKTDIF